MKNRLSGLILLAIYVATVPVANWMISNIGTQDFPGGPHTIPVGFGFNAPSGVLVIGLALVVRDVIQRRYGKGVALLAITVGVVVSYVLADPFIATASAVGFALGELTDFAIYTPMKRKSLVLAVAVSGIVGGIVDSLIFLQIAFGSVMYWEGQALGKAYVSVLAALVIWGVRCVTSRDTDRAIRS